MFTVDITEQFVKLPQNGTKKYRPIMNDAQFEQLLSRFYNNI